MNPKKHTKANTKTSKVVIYFKKITIPIFLVIASFFIYVKCFCYFSNTSSDADLVCSLSWKDGLFLISSYSIVKALSPLFSFDSIFKRLSITLLLYCFSFALIAFPFLLVSFFQPVVRNVFLHTSLIILTIEILFSYNDEKIPPKVDYKKGHF